MSGCKITACTCADHMERSCSFAFIVLSFVSVCFEVSLSLSPLTLRQHCVQDGNPRPCDMSVSSQNISSRQLVESWTALWFSSGLWWVTRERAEEIDVTDTTPLGSKTNIWTLTQTVDKHFHTLLAAPNFKYGQDTQHRFLSFPLCCSMRANADPCLKAFGFRMIFVHEVGLTFGFFFWGLQGRLVSRQLGDEPK